MEGPIFLVECDSSSATAEQAAQLLRRLSPLAGAASGPGPVTPVSRIAVPADQMCLCLVESDSGESLRQALSRMRIGRKRIVEAVQVSPDRGAGHDLRRATRITTEDASGAMAWRTRRRTASCSSWSPGRDGRMTTLG